MKVEELSPFMFDLKIGNHVRLMKDVEELHLSGFPFLRTVVIGIDSLYAVKWFIRDLPMLTTLRFEGETSKGFSEICLNISCCSVLKTVHIGNNLFNKGYGFGLNHLPKLETVTVGNGVSFSEAEEIHFDSPCLILIVIRSPFITDDCDWR